MRMIGEVTTVLFLTGCAGSIMATQIMSAEDLTMQSTATLCSAYGERGRFNKLEKMSFIAEKRQQMSSGIMLVNAAFISE